MSIDARICVTLPTHPKTRKLIKRHGREAAWSLVCLFLWAAANRSDGDLRGMSVEDIELAANWEGAEGELVKSLSEVGFLDNVDDAYSIHNWAEHNPWAAGANDRSIAAKWAALCKRYGSAGAAIRMPEYADRMRRAREPDAPRTKPQCPDTVSVSVTVSEPVSSPSKEVSSSPAVMSFADFYSIYPRKVGKIDAQKAFERMRKAKKLPTPDVMRAAIDRYVATKRPEIDYCHPATWLNGGRWMDGEETMLALPSFSLSPSAEPWRKTMLAIIGETKYRQWMTDVRAVPQKDTVSDRVMLKVFCRSKFAQHQLAITFASDFATAFNVDEADIKFYVSNSEKE